MSASSWGQEGVPPQDADLGSAFRALCNLGQSTSGAPSGGSGGESAAALSSPFTFVRDFSEELSLGGMMDFEEVEMDNLESEGVSACFRGSDALFDMEVDYDSRPEVPQIGVHTDRFS